MHNSPTTLPRALAPSTLKGCVGTLPNGYTRSAPLPRQRTDTYGTSRGRTVLRQNQSSVPAEPVQSTREPSTLQPRQAIQV
jgi:hypothetical protein